MGKGIVEKQEASNWGAGIIDQLATDLKLEFPDIDGFSRTNLHYIKQFYLFYSQVLIVPQPVVPIAGSHASNGSHKEGSTVSIVSQAVGQLANPSIVPQPVGQIPWGHHRLIIDKIKDHRQALFT